MSFYEKHKKGILGTAIFHVVVLVMLIVFGFFTPLPLPGEEGILVNFGDSDQGFGDIEPAPQRREPEPSPPVRQEQETAPPPVRQSVPPPPSSPPEPAREEAMTQDYEETAAIDAAEQKRLEEERERKLEADRRRQQELDRQRQAQLEQQRREAELERQRQAAEQKKIEEINSRAQGAFGGGTSGPGGQGTGTNPNQGVTFPDGNQGASTGDPNAGTYGPGGSGSGDQGTGVSYSLSGRNARSLPKPVYPGNDEGLVVVNITVDKYGNVTAAEPGVRGTTIMNQSFWNEAKRAALKAKFNIDENAPAFQQGTISYRFKLD